MNLKFLFAALFIFIISCQSDKGNEKNIEKKCSVIQIHTAELFKIEDFNLYQTLTVYDKSGTVTDKYYLVKKDKKIPSEISEKNIIRTPVTNVVCLSTTHIAFIDMLDETDKITAVSGSQYIYNPGLRRKIVSGKIKDVGYENSLDFELLLSLKPDVVTVYDINGTISPVINKIKKFNIPVIRVNEYPETSSLGQTEWIKFFGELFDKRKQAENKFNKVYNNYNELKQITDKIKNRPKVLLNLPWKGTWYIPGGHSNIAQLIQDAGGDYLWKNNPEKHNIPLNIEDVYLNASYADIWLNPGQANSLLDIIGTDIRLEKFKAVKVGNVYNRNKRLNEFGGNDYMETGTVRPDLILKDLIRILHPELLTEHELFYYTKLE